MIIIKKIVGYTTPIFCVIALSIFGLYNYIYYSSIPSYQKKLTTIVRNRAQEINDYLNKQEEYAIQLSQQKTITDMLISTTSKTPDNIMNIGEKNM